jgi:hypothetical protein
LSVADTTGLDFNWLTQLSDFDHWSLATLGPTAESAASVDPFSLPIPSYWLLVYYAKLRFVRALGDGNVADAMNEVQHLADLIHSNGIAIADAVASRIVGVESQFIAVAAQHGYSGVDNYAPLDPADAVAFHDIALAGFAFIYPGVDDAVAKRALSCMPSPCAALSERITLRREMESFTDTAEHEGKW